MRRYELARRPSLNPEITGPQSHSLGFFDFPAEIRNQVYYEAAFVAASDGRIWLRTGEFRRYHIDRQGDNRMNTMFSPGRTVNFVFMKLNKQTRYEFMCCLDRLKIVFQTHQLATIMPLSGHIPQVPLTLWFHHNKLRHVEIRNQNIFPNIMLDVELTRAAQKGMKALLTKPGLETLTIDLQALGMYSYSDYGENTALAMPMHAVARSHGMTLRVIGVGRWSVTEFPKLEIRCFEMVKCWDCIQSNKCQPEKGECTRLVHHFHGLPPMRIDYSMTMNHILHVCAIYGLCGPEAARQARMHYNWSVSRQEHATVWQRRKNPNVDDFDQWEDVDLREYPEAAMVVLLEVLRQCDDFERYWHQIGMTDILRRQSFHLSEDIPLDQAYFYPDLETCTYTHFKPLPEEYWYCDDDWEIQFQIPSDLYRNVATVFSEDDDQDENLLRFVATTHNDYEVDYEELIRLFGTHLHL